MEHEAKTGLWLPTCSAELHSIPSNHNQSVKRDIKKNKNKMLRGCSNQTPNAALTPLPSFSRTCSAKMGFSQ